MTFGPLARTAAFAAIALTAVAAAPLDPVTTAEVSVAATPQSAAARYGLGRAYLTAGRLQSARAAFTDALALAPADGRAALNLALVQIALDERDAALDTLAAHAEYLTAEDMGLARVLAGEVEMGVALLETAARNSAATARTRQNLALGYAMQGRWLEARAMARRDLSPADADARLLDWMQFVKPVRATDQVAGLLGITPTTDPGLPARLALGATPVQQAQAEPVPEGPIVQAVEVAAVEGPPTVAAAPTTVATVVFAPRREVVQPLPARVVTAALAPLRKAVAPVARPLPMGKAVAAKPLPTGGQYVVQLGAFGSEAIAQAAWNRRHQQLGLTSHTPVSARVRVKQATFVRLSVAGFERRQDAVQLCARVQQAGGSCFVRAAAGDTPVTWAQRSDASRIASR